VSVAVAAAALAPAAGLNEKDRGLRLHSWSEKKARATR